MTQDKRKYIDSHWLVFILQGIIAALFGCITLFAADKTPLELIPTVSLSLIALAVVEIANLIHRSIKHHGWIVSVLVALFDLTFGLVLLTFSQQEPVWYMVMIAGYTLVRGIFEILLGFRTTIDPTDQFIWVLCGMCGAIFGIVILNSGHLGGNNFVRFFGAYLLILGVSSLIYGAHNRTQQIEYASNKRPSKSIKSRTSKK